MNSYLEQNARSRIAQVFDADSFVEFLPPSRRVVSPHLAQFNAPASFDDGVVVGRARLFGLPVCVAAQEGGFMGGAIGEVHGAKLVGVLQRAVLEQVDAVILLLESGGARLQEANASLIAVAEVIRAVFEARAARIPVIVLIGGAKGCFGGTGVVASCCNTVVMSEQGRMSMSGPEVIETVHGVEEFDARDLALVWRSTGGKHRYLLGDCRYLVEDDVPAFRQAAFAAIAACRAEGAELTFEGLQAEHAMLAARVEEFGRLSEPMEIWRAIGIVAPEQVPMLEAQALTDLLARRSGAL